MGKFRTKLKGQTKGKRWPKGQSSSSNPETHKYRDQAKSRFFQVNLGPSNLTSDALKKHNAIQSTALIDNDQIKSIADETESTRASTFQTYDTFASDWSQCSNISFNKLLVNFRTNSALHKEMLAILAAITEVIKSNDGTETSTEYYAALMTTLEATESEESITAILSLLAMGIKTVPQSVLQTQFSNATNIYLQILGQYSQSDNNVINRSVLTCLAVCLRAQEIASWYNSSTVQIFDAILSFANHTKPKIRKAAQHAISSILNGSYFMIQGNPPDHHPVGAHVAQFCIKQIESSMGQSGGQTTILHTLSILKDIIQVFPKTQIKLVCETLLKIMTLNNALINANALQVIYSLFSGKKTVIPAVLNDQLIGALYDYQPSPTDIQPTLAWMAVMKQAHIHLADVDITMCMKRLPTIFKALVKLWLTERNEIISSVTLALDDLIKDCIGSAAESPGTVKTHQLLLQQCFGLIEQGLDYEYHTSWSHVLHLMKTAFQVAGLNCPDMLISYLKTLSSLRDSYKFSYNSELEFAVGAAVRTMGPETILKVIPLTNEDSKIILDRSWLLPVLKDNIQGSTLEYFGTKIVPLAKSCENESKAMFAKKNAVGGHSMELFASQLWSLFPSFCNLPTDILLNFKKIAQTIGMKISNDKNLRLPLMAGLRKLINQSQENAKDDCIQEMSRFAKNYIPILFNIYTVKPNGSDEEGQRLAALDTIRVYLAIAPDELRNHLFSEAIKQLTNSEDTFLRESVYDLIRLLAVYQTKSELENLYKQFIVKLYKNKNHKEQKKAYRLLEDICGSDQPGCVEFVKSNRKSLRGLLLKTLETTTSSSKAARLRCLSLIIFKSSKTVDAENKLVQGALVECINYMKDINEKCRIEAQNLLLKIGEALLVTPKGQEQFLGIIMAGFMGNMQMVVGTILGLASAVHHFTGSLGIENLQTILKTVSQLLISATREIVQACLAFIKVYITRLPLPQVANDLPLIVQSLCKMQEDTKRHFRIKLRNILDRLIRKFDPDTISKLIPNSDTIMHKRLRNLRKLQARKKRAKDKKEEEDAESDDDINDFTVNSKPNTLEAILADSDEELDDDEDDDAKSAQKRRSKKSGNNAWIQEDEDNIVDFTDTSAISKIRATNPKQSITIERKQKAKKENSFKTASDGRLIITDDMKDDDSDNDKKMDDFDSDDSDLDDAVSKATTLKLGGGKRKRSASDSVSIFSGGSHPAMKYRAGGSGIHRPTNKIAMETGEKYKAKKAAGDVKKKGKVEPYAYLPLRRSTLNKRKRQKNSNEFKKIVKGVTKKDTKRKNNKFKQGRHDRP